MDAQRHVSRGFGFVVFKSEKTVGVVISMAKEHQVMGKWIDVKPCDNKHTDGETAAQNSPDASKVKQAYNKIFVGGLAPDCHEDSLRAYFSTFGSIQSVEIKRNLNSQKSRGFGFVIFKEDGVSQKVLDKRFHKIGTTEVEVKQAQPEGAAPPSKEKDRTKTVPVTLPAAVVSYPTTGPIRPSRGGIFEAPRNPQTAPGGYSGSNLLSGQPQASSAISNFPLAEDDMVQEKIHKKKIGYTTIVKMLTPQRPKSYQNSCFSSKS